MKHQNGREGRRKENHYSFKKPLQKSKALVYQIHSVRIKELGTTITPTSWKGNLPSPPLPSPPLPSLPSKKSLG
jgi:hypothetical protein